MRGNVEGENGPCGMQQHPSRDMVGVNYLLSAPRWACDLGIRAAPDPKTCAKLFYFAVFVPVLVLFTFALLVAGRTHALLLPFCD